MYEILFRKLRPDDVEPIHVDITSCVFGMAHGRPSEFEKDAEALLNVAMDNWVDEHNVDAELTPEELGFVVSWARHIAEFAVKNVPSELQLVTERSQAFDAGNYDGAYGGDENTCAPPAVYRSHQRDGYVLGFFSSYELSEAPVDWQDELERLREQVAQTEHNEKHRALEPREPDPCPN
jgi:hypothetical protein